MGVQRLPFPALAAPPAPEAIDIPRRPWDTCFIPIEEHDTEELPP